MYVITDIKEVIEVPAGVIEDRQGCDPYDPYVEREREYYLYDIRKILSQITPEEKSSGSGFGSSSGSSSSSSSGSGSGYIFKL